MWVFYLPDNLANILLCFPLLLEKTRIVMHGLFSSVYPVVDHSDPNANFCEKDFQYNTVSSQLCPGLVHRQLINAGT